MYAFLKVDVPIGRQLPYWSVLGHIPVIVVLVRLGLPPLFLLLSLVLFVEQVFHSGLPQLVALLHAPAALALANVLFLDARLLCRHEFSKTLFGKDALLSRLLPDLARIIFAFCKDRRCCVRVF